MPNTSPDHHPQLTMASSEATPSNDTTRITNKSFFPSHSFMISCGCIGIDIPRQKIAVLRDTSTKPSPPLSGDSSSSSSSSYIHLPKGRKNISEDLLATALREGYEETGVVFTALPLRVATRATPLPTDGGGGGENPGLTTEVLNCEASSVATRLYADTGVWKMVFWFAAQGDSSVEPVLGTKEPWEEHHVLEWVDASEAAGLMTFEDDAEAVRKVLADVRRTGYVI